MGRRISTRCVNGRERGGSFLKTKPETRVPTFGAQRQRFRDFLMFVLSMVMWPVYVAGIQIITAEIAAGRRPGLVAALNEAVRFWPRVAALCVFVFGVFALLTLFGFGIALVVAAGASSVLLIFF